MNKLLCCYNTCGISGRDNVESYCRSIESILNQNLDNFKLVISSCLNSKETINRIINQFGNKISVNWIVNKIPVNCSFNHTVLKSIKRFGEFESYVYVDSGCNFEQQQNILSEMYELYKSGPYGMVTARTDTDTGFKFWLDAGKDNEDVEGHTKFFNQFKDHYIVPVGRAVNLPVQLFCNEIIKNYGNIIPDIFAGQCTESVFSFLNAAINKKWVIHKDIVIKHIIGMDIPSSGFMPWQWTRNNKPAWDHPFIINSIIERMMGDYKNYGGGYEELQSIMLHDNSKFDKDGYAIFSELKNAIKNTLYLNSEEFDYNKINHIWFN